MTFSVRIWNFSILLYYCFENLNNKEKINKKAEAKVQKLATDNVVTHTATICDLYEKDLKEKY